MKFFTIYDIDAENAEDVIQACGEILSDEKLVNDSYVDAVLAREKEYPTGLPVNPPVAIPHILDESINDSSIVYARLKKPVIFYQMDTMVDELLVQHVFCMALKNSNEHLAYLQKIIATIQSSEFMDKLTNAKGEDLFDIITQEFERSDE